MQTLIQHSLDSDIAQQISSDFKQLSTHIRHQVETIDIEALRAQHQTDFNYLPAVNIDQIKLFVSDMDSTLISIECIDEIADFANFKPEVAEITERAMQGELDFDASLAQRVALLKDLDISTLEQVYNDRLSVNPGGVELIEFLSARAIKSAVVSGGFTYFTNRLANEIGLDYARANTLGVENNKLTGLTQGKVINAHAKADFVRELCQKHGLDLEQVIVAGDGANDLEMMNIAGISVAYHAKPKVYAQADIAINYGGLDKIIDLFNPSSYVD